MRWEAAVPAVTLGIKRKEKQEECASDRTDQIWGLITVGEAREERVKNSPDCLNLDARESQKQNETLRAGWRGL